VNSLCWAGWADHRKIHGEPGNYCCPKRHDTIIFFSNAGSWANSSTIGIVLTSCDKKSLKFSPSLTILRYGMNVHLHKFEQGRIEFVYLHIPAMRFDVHSFRTPLHTLLCPKKTKKIVIEPCDTSSFY
jgi:hypothetical protein